MSVCLLLISDGRDDYLARTMESLADNLPAFDEIVHVEDREHELGFAGAIQEGWDRVLDTGCEFVWHQEDDFTYNRPVPLAEMIDLLRARPYLAQVCLRRQAVGHEVAFGGFMEQFPDWYTEHTDGQRTWMETTRNFTTNPSVYRSELCAVGWPDAPHSEGIFGFALREDIGLPWGVAPEEVRFGFWGSRKSGAEWVTHIGDERRGNGY